MPVLKLPIFLRMSFASTRGMPEKSVSIQEQTKALLTEVHQIRSTLSGLSDLLTVRNKALEDELHRYDSLFKTTIESIVEGILVVDSIGKISAFNKEFLQIWHIPDSLSESMDEDKFLAYAVDQLNDPETFLTRARDLSRDQSDASFDTIEFKDGRTMECSSKPQKIDGKTVARVLGFRDITDRVKTEKLLHNLNARLTFLNSITTILGRSLDFADTLKTIRRVLVPKVTDAYSIDVLNTNGRIECIDFSYPNMSISKAAKEVRQKFAVEITSTTGIPKVLRTGKSEIYSETSDLILRETFPSEHFYSILEQMRIFSIMLIPLNVRGHTFAVLTLMSTSIDRHFTWDDLRFAEVVSARVAIALDNAILFYRRERLSSRTTTMNLPNVLLNLRKLPLNRILNKRDLLK